MIGFCDIYYFGHIKEFKFGAEFVMGIGRVLTLARLHERLLIMQSLVEVLYYIQMLTAEGDRPPSRCKIFV